MSAFAVFCATDGSLIFYNRDTIPTAGDEFEGKIASNVYTGFDTADYSVYLKVPWYNEIASILSVSFTPEFATVKPLSTAYWFYNESNMTSFDGTNLDTSNVTNMSAMFELCPLTSLDLSNFNTSSVTNMSYMFSRCKALTSLDLSNFNTSSVTNMEGMFSGCSALTTIYVSDLWITAIVTSSNNMFYSCNKLVGAISYDRTVINATYANYVTGYLTYKLYFPYSENRFVVEGSDLNRIADAIRNKVGTSEGLSFPDGFISAIESFGVSTTNLSV